MARNLQTNLYSRCSLGYLLSRGSPIGVVVHGAYITNSFQVCQTLRLDVRYMSAAGLPQRQLPYEERGHFFIRKQAGLF